MSQASTNLEDVLTPEVGMLFNSLNLREKQILQALYERGELSQTQLQYATGIPKASMSRRIQKLSMSNLVSVEEYGSLKKIKLATWLVRRNEHEK